VTFLRQHLGNLVLCCRRSLATLKSNQWVRKVQNERSKKESPGPPCPGPSGFSPLRRANLADHQVLQRGMTRAIGDKNIFLHACHRPGVEQVLVMGFPSHYRFPPSGTPKPRCDSRRLGFSYDRSFSLEPIVRFGTLSYSDRRPRVFRQQ
jgi:hypothetical protein